MLSTEDIKMNVGRYATELLKNGMVIGLGTGSTANYFLQALTEKVNQGLKVAIVPTSLETKRLAIEASLEICELEEVDQLAMCIDGADEIDPQGNLIKGGGGALLQEKIVASAARELILIADHTKLVKQLGQFPLPVEVIPMAHILVRKKIVASFNCKEVILRQRNNNPFITDHGHYILDCSFGSIENSKELNNSLKMVAGIVETGLFLDMATRAIVGFPDGRIENFQFR